eukprot:maker-scaffold_36-snap-gene-1.3-mRNA-1 protein AED:0.00 eAED:0.00 QI:87/1/1/1/0.66/0.5/4/454/247
MNKLKRYTYESLYASVVFAGFGLIYALIYEYTYSQEKYDTIEHEWRDLAEKSPQFSKRFEQYMNELDTEEKFHLYQIIRSHKPEDASLEYMSNPIVWLFSTSPKLNQTQIAIPLGMVKHQLVKWDSLSLQFNNLGDEIIQNLCDLVSKPEYSQITSLFLEGNNITDSSACHCLQKVQNKRINKIHLDFNVLTDNFLPCLEKFLEREERVNLIDLYWNYFSIKGRRKLKNLQTKYKDSVSIWMSLPSP